MYSKLVNTENKACPCWPVMKLLSFVSNAEWHCLSLQDYLEDIFLKFSQSAQHRPGGLVLGSPLLLSLLPDRWGAMHPQHVNHQRLQEKRLIVGASARPGRASRLNRHMLRLAEKVAEALVNLNFTYSSMVSVPPW